jgi:hypothetical protein
VPVGPALVLRGDRDEGLVLFGVATFAPFVYSYGLRKVDQAGTAPPGQ